MDTNEQQELVDHNNKMVKKYIEQRSRAESAEKRVEEERLVGMKWFDDMTYVGAQLMDTEKRVAELIILLDERDNEAECLGKTAENLAKRVAELGVDIGALNAHNSKLAKRIYVLDTQLKDVENEWDAERVRYQEQLKRVAELEEIFKNECQEDCNCGFCKAYRRVISDGK